ncbi:putative endopeptidase [Undibacterium sp. GrIS 1.2]|uniref:M13 family metallopeptidase n=1 Tax=Undibacterium sp. GrIS 1.2 TaxID=3143933 RepID=UPI00339B4FE5
MSFSISKPSFELRTSALRLSLCGAAIVFMPSFVCAQALPMASATGTVSAAHDLVAGDDFFQFVNGDWLAKTEIPADKSSWGAGGVLAEDTNARIVKLIETAATDKAASSNARLVGDFYHAYMDEDGIEAKGIAPLAPMLKQIAAIKSKTDLAHTLGASLRADVDPLNNTNFFTENIFGLWVAQGLTDPQHNTAYLLQGGLGMPDRAYYLADSQLMAELRTKYQAHIAAMLKLAGFDDVEARAARVMSLEIKIAESHADRETSADVQKANNTWRFADFAGKAPGMDWNAFFTSAHLNSQKTFTVWHPSAVSGEAALVGATELGTWKDYLAFHTINHFGSVLPKAYVEQHFSFYGTALSDTPQLSLRWKRSLNATNVALDEAVGHLYVDRYFPEANKLRVRTMVDNIIAAFSRRIEQLDWMAPATRAQAQAKLKTLYVGVGYPDKWASYAGLTVSPTDALGNVQRAEQFHLTQQLAKLRKKVDRTEWSMPSHLVDAVNMPLQNSMNFPAAILQPPYFDPQASDTVNYGAIGAIIGHEISHSFDDQGAQFDAQGRLREWWSAADLAHFKTASGALAIQYSAYKPFPDLAINGQQTLSENLADLAGLAASLDAYHVSLKDNIADDRQFFIGYAQSWRNKARDAAQRQQILTDGHSPAKYRTATVRNLEAWYKAFDVQPGQMLYLAPADRVRVW